MTHEEIEKGFQEVWKLFAETKAEFDRRTAEAERLSKERADEEERRAKEQERRAKERAEEEARRDKEEERRSREAEKRSKELDKKIEALTGKWGRFVEGLIVPAAEKIFKARGINVDKIYQQARARKNGKEMEVDVLAVDGEHAVLIEVKSTLSVEDVREHKEKLMQFKKFFPEYSDKKVVGAVAGIVIQEEADKYAYREGMFIIGQSGESVKIKNDKKFIPKLW